MNTKKIALLAAICGLLPFCKSSSKVVSDAPKPAESYNNDAQEAPLVSTITVPVSININDLVQRINRDLSGSAMYEDYSYEDNGKDGLMMNIWKSRDVTLDFNGQSLKYRVPLKLWMKKDIYVGEAEAEAELALAFRTYFSVNPDWTLSTQTEVDYHEWLSKPVLKTGVGNINIESLANIVLNRSKKTLAQSLDETVRTQMSLRPYIQELWNTLQEPVLMSDEYKMWVKTTPLSIGMTPLSTDWQNIKAKIAVTCINDVSFGDKPLFRENTYLPNLAYITDAPDEFRMRFATDVPFPEAERLTRAMMLGYVMEAGKKKVKVEDIQLWGNNDRLVVNTRLSGDFVGNIYFMARPVFNAEKNQIEATDLDYHVDTRNLLLKSASWMFQGAIKNQMKKAMAFPLDENIAELKKSVQETLAAYELQPGIILSGTLDSVRVEQTRLTPTSIRVDLFSKGRINVDVKGL